MLCVMKRPPPPQGNGHIAPASAWWCGPRRRCLAKVRRAMALVHHDDTELMAATDWVIDGTLLDVTGQPLDLSNPELTWTLIGLEGLPVLANGDVTNTKTALLECGRYIDALQLTIGDIVSPLWLGQILVAANPRRVTSPLSAGSGTARA